MTMGIATFCIAALCFVGLDLISCASTGTGVDGGILHENTNDHSESKPSHPVSVSTQLDSDRLPSENFPAEITEFLSPEVFSQSDPLIYFLEKTIKFSRPKLRLVGQILHDLLNYRKVPSRYILYAALLRNLLQIHIDIDWLKNAIRDVRRSSDSDYPPLPDGLLSPEFAGLFSSDVFLDDRYPFRLIVKLMNLSESEITELGLEFRWGYLETKVPARYDKYSRELHRFITNDHYLRRLLRIVSKLRNITSGGQPAPDGQHLKSD